MKDTVFDHTTHLARLEKLYLMERLMAVELTKTFYILKNVIAPNRP